MAEKHPPSRDPVEDIRFLVEESLEQTDQAIRDRRRLTKRFLREIEKEIAEAVKMLRFLGEPWQRGDRPDYEAQRIALDKALTARRKERRERLLQEWRDLLELRAKRIEVLRELVALGASTKKPVPQGDTPDPVQHL